MRLSPGTLLFAAALLLTVMSSGAAARCIKGRKGCLQCASRRKCKTCKNGWSLAPNGACVRCADGCKKCGWRNPLVCTGCYVGTFLKKGTCRKCPAPCTACALVQRKLRCSACRKGFKLRLGKCVRKTPRSPPPPPTVFPPPPTTVSPPPPPPPPPHTCLPTKPVWDSDAFAWMNVTGVKDDGTCVPCTPGGNHAGWCKACDGDAPTVCTECEDFNNGFPMYISLLGNCEFCTALHVGCLACQDGDGACTQCDAASNYVPDGLGGCMLQP